MEFALDQFATSFIKRRALDENFVPSDHSFFVHDLEHQYLSCLLTGYVKDFYYMKKAEVLTYAMELHREMLRKDPLYHLTSLKVAREIGMKDQVMIGLLEWGEHRERAEHFDELVTLLGTFPPSQIVKKYIRPKRKKIVGGFGSFDKRLISSLWAKWEEQGKLSYYLVKYRPYMEQIVRLIHIRTPSWPYIIHPSKYDGPDNYLTEVSNFFHTKEFSGPKFPFELVRGNIPKSQWKGVKIEETDMTGNTIVMQACSLYEALGNKFIPLVRGAVNSPTLTSDKILKALIRASEKQYDKLTRELGTLYTEKVKGTYKHLLLPVTPPNIGVVLDASGSMEPETLRGMFFTGLSLIAPFAPLVSSLVLFSDEAKEEDEGLLMDWEGLNILTGYASLHYNGGTDITSGIIKMMELINRNEVNTVIIFSDEQANLIEGGSREMGLIKKLLDEGIEVIVINPTPYPVKVTDIRDKRLIYIPACNPESLAGALKLIQLRGQLKERDGRELIYRLEAVYN